MQQKHFLLTYLVLSPLQPNTTTIFHMSLEILGTNAAVEYMLEDGKRSYNYVSKCNSIFLT